MCLDGIKETYKTPRDMKGYKILNLCLYKGTDGGHITNYRLPFIGTRLNKNNRNEIYVATERRVSFTGSNETYLSGFHFYVNLNEAEEAFNEYRVKCVTTYKTCLVECSFGKVTKIGYERDRLVGIAKTMKIEGEIECI